MSVPPTLDGGHVAALEAPPGADSTTSEHIDATRYSALPLVRHILELEALGWHVVKLRPSASADEPPLWHVTIERYDEGATMTMTEADPDVALAELVRYAQADAT